MLKLYLDYRKKELYQFISSEIKKNTVQKIVQTVFVEGYLGKKQRFIKGHNYYLNITNKKPKLLKIENFMHTFKAKYGLSYIDTKYLNLLEKNKNEILSRIGTKPIEIFKKYFESIPTIRNGKIGQKKLTSFFTKLAHTVSPNKFVAMDNPIRKYFKLEDESFMVSYDIINETFKDWIKKNKKLL
ncbi:MAG: hypothetical protein IPQ02_15120 [Saprospiraceae bacterium]|nr:hypothetical protein [Candidatus Defluviibacterium haderslevense]